MEALEHFQQRRLVIEDFTSRTLAAIASDFGRLFYISSLKDANTGRYQHDGLTSLYSEDSVQEALTQCHQEIFSRILETPLHEQERDLQQCLLPSAESSWQAIEDWGRQRLFLQACPYGLPSYLSDLFASNLSALLAIIGSQRTRLALAS